MSLRLCIGANCSEAKYAQSRKDFINKYSIAIKEANETLYWMRIMINSNLISNHEFSQMMTENETIIKILTASINKLKT
ncbi:MAG: four helix bundle protein [Cyanobacteria bacterium P01_G01_bin.49]